MRDGCEYCQNYKNILYYNNIDDDNKGAEITLGVSKDGWYLEINTSSDKKVSERMTDVPYGSYPDTPLNYCPVCGMKFN